MKVFFRNKKGFSLVELLTVVSIIGILAMIGIPRYQQYRAKALQAEAKTLLNAVHGAEKVFFLEYQGYHHSLKVLGVSPHGKARYNVGFGSTGPVPASAPQDLVYTTTKSLCAGAFGAGTDINCNMFISTPDIQSDATITATTYQANALAFDELLMASQTEANFISLAGNAIFGEKAHAYSMSNVLNDAMIDFWFIDQNNILQNKKMLQDCGAAGNCEISLTPPTE